ncbi:MAG: DUF1016 family protein [Candidatus Omnitrophica bacterium]|nr:DUF1016 family protein [Candidatus Omnitrophota bacterium]
MSAVPRKLTWAHYCELLPIKEEQTRNELAREAAQKGWTSDALRRKIREEKTSVPFPTGTGRY